MPKSCVVQRPGLAASAASNNCFHTMWIHMSVCSDPCEFIAVIWGFEHVSLTQWIWCLYFFIFYFFSTHFIVCLLWSQIAGLNIFAMFPCAEGRIHEAVIFTWCCFFGKYKLVKQIYGLSLSNFLLCCRTGRSHQWADAGISFSFHFPEQLMLADPKHHILVMHIT